jgi:hypothetical protein
MSRTGRPRVINDDKRRDICTLTTVGFSIENVARFVGCAASTIRRELDRNPEFSEQFRKANLARELGPLNNVRQTALTNWRAAVWYLERINPTAFVKPSTRYITHEQFALAVDALISEVLAGGDEKHERRVKARLAAFVQRFDREVAISRGSQPMSHRELARRDKLVEANKPMHLPNLPYPDSPTPSERRPR